MKYIHLSNLPNGMILFLEACTSSPFSIGNLLVEMNYDHFSHMETANIANMYLYTVAIF